MRIVDFKELLTLPTHTLFSVVQSSPARHCATILDLFMKRQSVSGEMNFHADKVNLFEGHEFSLPEVAKAYVRNEPIDVSLMTSRSLEFSFDAHATLQFAVLEKHEILYFVEKFKQALSVFPEPVTDHEHPFGVTVTGLRGY